MFYGRNMSKLAVPHVGMGRKSIDQPIRLFGGEVWYTGAYCFCTIITIQRRA
jgi:hypothetical protein